MAKKRLVDTLLTDLVLNVSILITVDKSNRISVSAAARPGNELLADAILKQVSEIIFPEDKPPSNKLPI